MKEKLQEPLRKGYRPPGPPRLAPGGYRPADPPDWRLRPTGGASRGCQGGSRPPYLESLGVPGCTR
eukprot:15445270-Alexandrium_andersonii.AAC.1